MIHRLFCDLERHPQSVVYERELLRHDSKELLLYKQIGLIVRLPSLEPENYCCRSDGGMLLVVENPDGTLEGIDEEDPEVDPVLLEDLDLIRWRLDLEACAHEFQQASGLRGRSGPLDDRLFFLGEKRIEDSRVAVVLGLFSDEATALRSMFGLSNLVSQSYGNFVVACPSYMPTPLVSRQLSSLDIEVIQLDPEDPFTLEIQAVPHRPRMRGPRIVLSDDEEAEFQQHQFKYRLPIHVTEREVAHNATVVLLNGRELPLPLAPFRLFLWILGGLFQNPSGFIAWKDLQKSPEDLWDGHIAPEGTDQALRRLRERFESPVGGSLKGTEFIQQRHRQVRISTHRRYVSYDLQGLLTHSDEWVRLLAARLPNRGII